MKPPMKSPLYQRSWAASVFFAFAVVLGLAHPSALAAAPPAPVRRELVHLPAQVISRYRVPRQELIEAAREGLAFMAELLSELWALRRAVAPPGLT